MSVMRRPSHANETQRSMASRITARFSALKREGRAGLVTFTMAGDPDGPASASLKSLLLQRITLDISQKPHTTSNNPNKQKIFTHSV